MSIDHQALFEHVIDIMNRQDWDALGDVYHDDYVEEYPQSGEVIRGLANARAVRESYPGGFVDQGLEDRNPRVIGTAPEWVRTPAFTVVRVAGTGTRPPPPSAAATRMDRRGGSSPSSRCVATRSPGAPCSSLRSSTLRTGAHRIGRVAESSVPLCDLSRAVRADGGEPLEIVE